MELLLDSLFNGVAIGSVLLVAALGLAIVFGLMGVINLAHGELMMLGAYTTYVTQLIFKLPILKPFYNSYIIVSIFLAFIVSGVVGILLRKNYNKKALWKSTRNTSRHLGRKLNSSTICQKCTFSLWDWSGYKSDNWFIFTNNVSFKNKRINKFQIF